MDITLLDCDVQPNYVRVTLKGKVCEYFDKGDKECLGLELNTLFGKNIIRINNE